MYISKYLIIFLKNTYFYKAEYVSIYIHVNRNMEKDMKRCNMGSVEGEKIVLVKKDERICQSQQLYDYIYGVIYIGIVTKVKKFQKSSQTQ